MTVKMSTNTWRSQVPRRYQVGEQKTFDLCMCKKVCVVEVSLKRILSWCSLSNIWLENSYSLDDEGIFDLLKCRLVAESGFILLLIKVREDAVIRLNDVSDKYEI